MKKNILTSTILGIISFVIYFFTAPASIYTGDSGEIATAVWSWGIAHPTGFPIYLVLGKLFTTAIPFWEFAFQLNIFSGFCAALTVGVLFLILRNIKIEYWSSIATSLSLAFAYTFWSHATVARVYSLSALFFVLAILIFLHWIQTRHIKWLYILAVVLAFGTGTHLTFLLILPFLFVFWILTPKKPKLTFKKVFFCFSVFLFFCVVIYSYIPLRASQSPELNWGNPSTKSNFINYITQKDYSSKIGTRSTESWKVMLSELGKLFNREFTFIGLLFILMGAWIAKKKNIEWFWAGFTVIIFNLLLLANYGNSEDIIILYRYFLPSYIIMAVFIAIVLNYIRSVIPAHPVIPAKAGILFLILPLIIFGWHFKDLNRHDYTLLKNTTNYILESVPKNSILITSGDTLTGAMMYEQIVLNKRADLVIIDNKLFTHLNYKENKKKKLQAKKMIYADNLVELAKNNQKNGVYFIDNSFLKNQFKFLSNGLTYKAILKDSEDIFDIKGVNKKFWKGRELRFLENKNFDKEYWNKELVRLYTAGLNNFSAWLTNNGSVEEGIFYFKKSLGIRENKNALYNLTGIYSALGERGKTLEYKKRFNSIKEGSF